MSKYIDANLLRKEIERQRQFIEELFTEGDNSFYDGQDDAYCYILALLAFLDSIQEQPVEGLDVTDFCKPVDPSIAKCVADHWWEMIGEESTNKKLPEDVEEAAWRYAQNEFPDEPRDNEYSRRIVTDAFIAGAEYQRKQDQSLIELAEDHAMLAGMNKMKEEIMEKIESRISEILGDAQPNPVLRIELQGIIDKIKNCI